MYILNRVHLYGGLILQHTLVSQFSQVTTTAVLKFTTYKQ